MMLDDALLHSKESAAEQSNGTTLPSANSEVWPLTPLGARAQSVSIVWSTHVPHTHMATVGYKDLSCNCFLNGHSYSTIFSQTHDVSLLVHASEPDLTTGLRDARH